MMVKRIYLYLALCLLVISCSNSGKLSVVSPDNNVKVNFELAETQPVYSVNYKGREVILPSAMGFALKEKEALSGNFSIAGSQTSTYDETWEQVWGEKQFIKNNYNELKIDLTGNDGNKQQMSIVFRVFNDGVAFRYIVPEESGLGEFVIMDELSEFNMAGDHSAWWIPAYDDQRYENLYSNTPISQMDTVHTPVTFETADGLFLSIHEAALVDFASMTIAPRANNQLKADLVPWADGDRVKTKAPMQSPWRTISIAEKPGDLITNYMVLNLNEPNQLDDLSYIKPSKYIGIWWGMHIGKYTFWESPNLGASTKNSKMYIDFASKHGIPLLLIEGWNKGWTPAWYENRMHEFSFTQSVDDFDLKEVVEYGNQKGVKLIGYHETGSNLISYLDQIDAGFALYREMGIHDIKIGQVGSRLNMKEWHHGQFGVNYYRYVLKKAAEYQLAVNFHEPIKDTGERRTYPNMMTREGARGMEYDAWSEGNPPNHLAILPFTRLLSGPMDFTPGTFDIMIEQGYGRRVHTTVAKQLAAYVVVLSPTQMMSDLPEYYEGNPAFQFLLDVPVDWYDTQVLNAEIGEYITMVRRDKHSDDWYLGSLSNEKARDFEVSLSFLEDGRKYLAQIYADGDNADLETNPTEVKITEVEVDKNTVLPIKLVGGGGQAIRFKAL